MQNDNDVRVLAQLLDNGCGAMHPKEQRAIRIIAKRVLAHERHEMNEARHLTPGEKLADRVVALGGSWTFLILFLGALVAWITLNSWMLTRDVPDPYPYILLNLVLSMLAAVQAPIIMMSQNRQAAIDRQTAKNDYEVNLRAEMEIISLHDKLDAVLKHLAVRA